MSALADFEALRDLQRAWFDFRNATSALKAHCSKINQRWPTGLPSDLAVKLSMRAEKHTGRFSNPQALGCRAGEHKCQNDPLLLALLKFSVAAQNLHDEWEQEDGTHAIDRTLVYPFQESFEDVLTKISTWTETTFRIVDGYCASCCLPDHSQCSLTAGCPCCDMSNSQNTSQEDTRSVGAAQKPPKKDTKGTRQ